jgi:cell division protein FtsN
MGRRDYKNTRRPQQEGQAAKPRKGGGLGTGLFVGVILGMAIAGGMYWYLNSQPTGLKIPDSAPDTVSPKSEPIPSPEPPPPPPKKVEPVEPPAPKPTTSRSAQNEVARPIAPAGTAKSNKTPARADPAPTAKSAAANDYSFYDILSGKTAPKPNPPEKPKEQYWLQVAALKGGADAERLKARLVLLGLSVTVQRVDAGETTLHRVRVGPFKSEDDGLGALDTLAENNFEPRWVKDPITP